MLPEQLVRTLLTILGYLWALPNSLLGLVLFIVLAPFGARASWIHGALEVSGRPIELALRYGTPRGMALALTLGHVILAPAAHAHAMTRSHERVHVAQYERWGPFFLPAYALSSLWHYLRGGDPYRDNCFEREAYQAR